MGPGSSMKGRLSTKSDRVGLRLFARCSGNDAGSRPWNLDPGARVARRLHGKEAVARRPYGANRPGKIIEHEIALIRPHGQNRMALAGARPDHRDQQGRGRPSQLHELAALCQHVVLAIARSTAFEDGPYIAPPQPCRIRREPDGAVHHAVYANQLRPTLVVHDHRPLRTCRPTIAGILGAKCMKGDRRTRRSGTRRPYGR